MVAVHISHKVYLLYQQMKQGPVVVGRSVYHTVVKCAASDVTRTSKAAAKVAVMSDHQSNVGLF